MPWFVSPGCRPEPHRPGDLKHRTYRGRVQSQDVGSPYPAGRLQRSLLCLPASRAASARCLVRLMRPPLPCAWVGLSVLVSGPPPRGLGPL